MDKCKSTGVARKILIADDDPCVLSAIADRCTRMGFDVETATNGLQVLIKVGRQRPDILVIDVHMPEVDGLSVLTYLPDIAKRSLHVVVVTGNPGQEIAAACDGLDAFCVRKGPAFWTEFEARLVEIYPDSAVAIRQSAKAPARPEVKKLPRVLLVDDDVSIKRMFFRRFERLGAELLYSSDATFGFWKARREQPTVIVADFCMPRGDAEYLLTRLRHAPETRSIPVIIQSGRCLSAEVKHRLAQPICGQPGAARILRKSFDGRELYQALQRFCGFASNLDGEALYN